LANPREVLRHFAFFLPGREAGDEGHVVRAHFGTSFDKEGTEAISIMPAIFEEPPAR